MNTAIAIFAWRRPQHLAAVLKSLSANKEIAELPVYIFLDGPRTTEDEPYCEQCLQQALAFSSAYSKQIIRANINKGLFNSIIEGVSEVLLKHETIIVLEDDIVVSPYFLSYMLQGLSLYQDDNAVASIHAYLPQINSPFPASFFLPGADCWGWATWREQWKCMRFDAHALAYEIRERKLVHRFNLNQNYDYLRMLDERSRGLNNSWAILWHASCFLAGKISLYPGRSLVSNIGLDGTGEHCISSAGLSTTASQAENRLTRIEPFVITRLFDAYAQYFAQHSVLKRFIVTIRQLIYTIRAKLPALKKPIGLCLHGPYSSFSEAKLAAGPGYSSQAIVNKVSSAATALISGLGNYERDGTLFPDAPPDLVLTQLLSDILSSSDGSIIDFGGGLGGTYLNHRHLFLDHHTYVVIEQDSFVSQGASIAKKYSLPIVYSHSLDSVESNPLLVILSSVLQYIEDFSGLLQMVLSLKPKYIIIDRTSLSRDGSQSWWVQDETRYYGSKICYPISLIPETDLLTSLPGYLVRRTWHNDFDPVIPHHRGYLFQQME